MKQAISPLLKIGLYTLGCLSAISEIAYAQVIPDGTVNTQVNQNGNVSEIFGGETRGNNLFHSFQEFSVDIDNEAFFNNLDTIENIFSRVTGDNISFIDGLIRANGSANLFLLNPAGIIFGPDARLDIGGSFIGTTAESILFADGIEFSATDTQSAPILTINTPIGLNFGNNPEDIINESVVTDDNGTPDDFNDDDLIGLRVPTDETIALIGGNVFIDGGFVTTIGGRIELGSVAENSKVSLTPIAQGFDVGYGEVANFQDISLSFAALVNNSGTNPGDIEVQGRNISLIEGSQIGIEAEIEGEADDVNIVASESLTLDGNAAEIDLGNFQTLIFSNIFDDATGDESSININTPQLTITNGAQIATNNDFGNGLGADININTSKIIIEKSFFIDEPILSGIFANVFEEGTGDGGNILITTEKLTLNDGAQITTVTFGPGNAGELIINASELIELNSTISDIEDNTPSAISANVGEPLFPIPTAGSGGDITISTPRLVVSDGAQIATTAQNDGDGGNLTLNVSDSILLKGTSPSAELGGEGRSGIFVNAEPSFVLDGEIIPTTGNGGNLTLNTESLIIEQGAFISADTLSLGDGGIAKIKVNQLILRDGGRISAGSLLGVEGLDNERGKGGNLDIIATESVEITGIGEINGESVNSSVFTLAESNGKAGDTTLTTSKLTVSDGGDINARATSTGAAGNIIINANSVDLDQGSLTAATAAGKGNVTLDIDDSITLRNESLISAEATGTANGGNLTIDSEFIVAYPSQPNGNDILAKAPGGTGGNIDITATSLLNIEARKAIDGNGTNDIDASGIVDGVININNPDVNPLQGLDKLPTEVVDASQLIAKSCLAGNDETAEQQSEFTITGRGGLPTNPNESLRGDAVLSPDWVNLDSETADKKRIDRRARKQETIVPPQIEIVQVTGWIIKPDGKVRLIANNPNAVPSSPFMKHPHCQASK